MTAAELAAAIVGSYPKLTPMECCSFGVLLNGEVANKGTAKYYSVPNIKGVCHMALTYVQPNTCDELLTSYPLKTDVHLRFLHFLKFKMFKDWQDHIHLEQLGKNYYIRVSGLDTIPAQILYCFCIASRAIVEYPEAIVVWDKLVKLGVHPTFAFMVCEFDKFEDGVDTVVLGYNYKNSNHAAIIYTSDVSLVLNGPVPTNDGSFAANPDSVTPMWNIWGSNNSLKSFFGKTIRQFSEQWAKDHPNDEDILLAS